MRADVPDAVLAASERATRASLVFDRARLAANLRDLAAAARAQRIVTLFAAKSFPHPEVWDLAAAHLDGFDAASANELRALPPSRVVSMFDPTGGVLTAARTRPGVRLIASCDHLDHVRAAPAGADVAIRISASLTGSDPALGAVLDGSGHRRSRFGLDTDADQRRATIAAIVGEARGRRIGLHLHHGPLTATSAVRFVATARAALAVAHEAGMSPAFLNLGGAWHGISDLSAAFAQLRDAVPHDIELLIEPGRVVTREAGFACGRVEAVRELDDRRMHVLDLSRICHLRWSQVDLVGTAPHPGDSRNALVVGPTCFEDDVIGEWTIRPEALDVGTRVILRGVTGYAAAWNTSFGGVPAADVVFTDNENAGGGCPTET